MSSLGKCMMFYPGVGVDGKEMDWGLFVAGGRPAEATRVLDRDWLVLRALIIGFSPASPFVFDFNVEIFRIYQLFI